MSKLEILLKKAKRILLDGDLEDALKMLNDWLNEHPTDGAAYKMRASISAADGRFQDALDDLKLAMENGHAADVSGRFEEGTCLIELRRFPEAFRVFSEVIDSSDEPARSYFFTSALLFRAIASVHCAQFDPKDLRLDELGDARQLLFGRMWDKQVLRAEVEKIVLNRGRGLPRLQ